MGQVHTRWGHRSLAVATTMVALGAVLTEAPKVTRAADHNDPMGVQAVYKSGSSGAGYEVSTGDPEADIADLFAWYRGPQGRPESVVFAMTWRADPVQDKERSFDPSVAYGIHIDTSDKGLLDVRIDNDGIQLDSKYRTKATHDIVVWFGEHKQKKGQWGMRVSGLPGVPKEVVGRVGKVVEPAPGVRVAAGLFDDAFFADLDTFFNAISVALGNKPGNNPSLPLDRFRPIRPDAQPPARPFGYPADVDGFSRQNVHGIVIELPASAFSARKLHVWGTTERKQGAPKSGRDLRCTYAEGTYHCDPKGGPR